MKNKNVYILSACRTPIGSFGGSLSKLSAVQLGTKAIKGACIRSGLSVKEIDEVFMGNVLSAGLGQSPARQAALGAGVTHFADATTINKVCSSGMKAISMGYASILLGKADVVVSGGMESMSNAPFYLRSNRFGQKLGHTTLEDGLLKDGLWDTYFNFHMGSAAELCVEKYNLTREEQDNYTILSFEKAAVAHKQKAFDFEIIPFSVEMDNFPLDSDEELHKYSRDKIPQLKPIFEKNGTITAANSSNLNDGAAALILSSQNNIGNQVPLAEIIDYVDVANSPEWYTTAPAKAINKLLVQNGLSIDDIDLFEINEAYSCVPMVNSKLLNIPLEKINILGGAVALGHPIGASGARIVVTLINALHKINKSIGIAAICNGGGGTSALLIKRY